MRLTRLLRILALLFWIAAVVCLLSCGWSWASDVNAWETPYRMAKTLRFDWFTMMLELESPSRGWTFNGLFIAGCLIWRHQGFTFRRRR